MGMDVIVASFHFQSCGSGPEGQIVERRGDFLCSSFRSRVGMLSKPGLLPTSRLLRSLSTCSSVAAIVIGYEVP